MGGFPTIKLYPAGKKGSPVDYTGDRSVENLVSFIGEHGSHHVVVSVMEPVQVQEQGKVAEAATSSPGSTSAEAAKETTKEPVKEEKKKEGDVHDEL